MPAQPYFRFDTNDYSLDPRLVGKRVELRASQVWIHRDRARNRQDGLPPPKSLRRRPHLHRPGPPDLLDEMRAERLGYQPKPKDTEIEIRPLTIYDELIPV
ncbi:MAG: hypothetical protein IPK93_10430 [Solirubrobacterales bacterium]|nr:hypothetical protein [Solirubrobacterales bacterium]